MQRDIKFLAIIIFTFAIGPAFGQKLTEGQSLYKGEADSLSTIKKVALLPFSDNVQGIYSRPLELYLSQLIKNDHHWDLKEFGTVGPVYSPDELEEKPMLIKSLAKNMSADAFLTSRIIKGPKGIQIKMSLFTAKDGLLFAQEIVKNYKSFELSQIKEKMEETFHKVKSTVPYQGLVLSRQGQRVTVNLGKNDGMTPKQVVSAVQIIKLNRHPKFKFVINSEKEIIGKIRLIKVDKTLSFGKIITEKESGAIQKNAKISGIDQVNYSDTHSLSEAKSEEDALMSRPDSHISFGKKPKAWLPQKPPTFGQVGVRLGLGMFNGAMNTTPENLNADDPYYPNIAIEGELWITPEWSIHAAIRQGILKTDNPQSGGQPSELNYSLGSHELLTGYNVRLGPGVWGPKIELLAGFSTYKLFVDDSGTSGFTTMKYSGLKLGALGSYPITADHSWSAGTKLFFILNAKLTENPQSSGKSDNTINQFSFFVAKKLFTNLRAEASLDYELYSTKFSGGTVTNSSRKHTTLSGGLFYLF